VTQTSEPRAAPTALTFEEFAAAKQAGLIRFGYLLLRDHQLAQDLAQEGLARLHSNWLRIAADGNPEAYVRKVMVNQLLTWRRRRAWSERPVADVRDVAGPDAAAAVGDRAEMWAMIGELPMRQRAVIVLRYYEDLDDAAIGVALGCTSSTVATHANRALARLRSVARTPESSSQGTS
jgi:RNA polymerase sigma-70 factor (sigma-E family)